VPVVVLAHYNQLQAGRQASRLQVPHSGLHMPLGAAAAVLYGFSPRGRKQTGDVMAYRVSVYCVEDVWETAAEANNWVQDTRRLTWKYTVRNLATFSLRRTNYVGSVAVNESSGSALARWPTVSVTTTQHSTGCGLLLQAASQARAVPVQKTLYTHTLTA
jgi:hypothetical protein